ncbi:hypothetical protein V8C86DRAFT_2596265 [Haematococcus lacustris]
MLQSLQRSHQLLQLYLLLCCHGRAIWHDNHTQPQHLDPHWYTASLCQVVDCSCHQIAVVIFVSTYEKLSHHQGLGEGVQR